MKFLLVVIIGVLLWNNNEARKVTADSLNNIADIIEPDTTKNQSIGERIDSFLDWTSQSLDDYKSITHFTLILPQLMTKQAIIKALDLCENGNQMLQFIEGLNDYQNEVIQSDAVSFSGEPVTFWIYWKGAQNAPFLCHIDKDYAFFILKKVF